VATLLEELRARRIVCPPLSAIERLAGSVRAHAQRQLWRRLADGLTDQQRQSPDNLLEVRVGGGQSTLAWLRQTAYAATTGNFPKLIERLTLVRAPGVEPERATRVHQNHWLKLAREGGQSTVQHLAELEPLRRYATLTALVLELSATDFDEQPGLALLHPKSNTRRPSRFIDKCCESSLSLVTARGASIHTSAQPSITTSCCFQPCVGVRPKFWHACALRSSLSRTS
jgi:hypothetical protein